MRFFIENKLIGFLLILSILLLTCFAANLFKSKVDLLEQNHNTQFNKVLIGNVKGEFSVDNAGAIISQCSISPTPAAETHYCGIHVKLSESVQQGVDFSRYSFIEYQMLVQSPIDKPRIKLAFRNYDHKYAVANNPSSLKFNSILLSPNSDKTATLDLSYLQVETWWVDKFLMDIEDSRVDLSNVVRLEISHYNTLPPGEYEYRIKKLVLHGEYVSLIEVLLINSFIWIFIIYLLIQRQNQSLKKLATIDALTGLTNRRGLQEWVDKLKISAESPKSLSLFYIDIDDFKSTNDTYGHQIGDALLQNFCLQVAQTLEGENKYSSYVFSRMSGDEFVILIHDLPTKEAAILATNILESLKEPMTLGVNEINVNVSMGIAFEVATSNDLSALFELADSAMYFAKKAGKNQFKLFSDNKDESILQHKSLLKSITEAIKLNQFDLKFMPIFDVKTKLVKNVEVLVRADSPELANVNTATIIEIAEEFKIIKNLDTWVLENTLSLLNENREMIENLGLTFCINVSTLDFKDVNFYENIKNCLQQHNIPPNWIELEITENAFVNKNDPSIDCLHKLKKLGVGLALDDFGTGYTAFNQLIHYPVNKLKIDRTFVNGIECGDQTKQVFIDAIFSIAKTYQLSTTAVGVENLDQYYALVDKGCDYIQGYLFSEPLTLRELARGLRNQDRFGFTTV